MITKTDILKMARHIVRKGEGYPDRRIMHPVRDWFIGLSLATACFVGVAVGAGYMYVSKLDTVSRTYSGNVEAVTYDQKRIDRVLQTYQEREAQFEILRGNRTFAPEASPTTEGGDGE